MQELRNTIAKSSKIQSNHQESLNQQHQLDFNNYILPHHQNNYQFEEARGSGNESQSSSSQFQIQSSPLPYHQDNTHQAFFHQNLHVCKMCDNKGFATPARLNRHLKTHLNDEEKAYSCQMCEKRFSAKWNLDRHVKEAHEGLKRDRPARNDPDKPKKPEEFHVCPVCEKAFSHRTSLTRHIRSHSDDKPYECDICQKSFVQASDLGRHSRVHTGEKPFPCTMCDRKFTQSANLSRHLKYHETLKAKKIVYGRDMCVLKETVDYKKLHEIEKGKNSDNSEDPPTSSAFSQESGNLKSEEDDEEEYDEDDSMSD